MQKSLSTLGDGLLTTGRTHRAVQLRTAPCVSEMDYGELIEPGCTPGWVELSRLPSGVYILNLLADANPENRWILPFNQAIMKAFDALEDHLEFDAGDLPAALLTISQSPKFFSNGIDPTGSYSKQLGLEKPSEIDALEGIILGMPGFIRPLQLPIPTIAAIGGHAFGAGMCVCAAPARTPRVCPRLLGSCDASAAPHAAGGATHRMFAVAHDYRLQREDRGYMCAIEVEIGVGIPPPEMELFAHAVSKPAFYQTVMGAKRWGADDALDEGLIVAACPMEELYAESLQYAESQAKLAAGPALRRNFMAIKHKAKGHVERMVMEHTFPHGELPKPLAQNDAAVAQVKEKYPHFLAQISKQFVEPPVVDPEAVRAAARVAAMAMAATRENVKQPAKL
jgi:enoyl-CoA hydratase/carnithine racemase